MDTGKQLARVTAVSDPSYSATKMPQELWYIHLNPRMARKYLLNMNEFIKEQQYVPINCTKAENR